MSAARSENDSQYSVATIGAVGVAAAAGIAVVGYVGYRLGLSSHWNKEPKVKRRFWIERQYRWT